MQGQAVDALEQRLDVGRAPLLLRGRGLLHGPLDKLLHTAAAEVPQRAVQGVDQAILQGRGSKVSVKGHLETLKQQRRNYLPRNTSVKYIVFTIHHFESIKLQICFKDNNTM